MTFPIRQWTHRPARLGLAAAAMMLSLACQAQLYKSVGPDGKISYSDTPPTGNQKVLEKRELGEAISTVNLPYELAQAVKKNPVTIYTAQNCSPCQDGKNQLKSAGVPFSEKTVKTNEDLGKLQQLSKDTQLPFLLVGSQKLSGYNRADWTAALKNAGYPSTNMLPPSYRYPAPESAAPAAAVKPADNAAETRQPARPPASPASGENGFRF